MRKLQRPILVIDVAGTLLTAGIVVSAAWFSIFKPDTATSKMRVVAGELAHMRADLAQLQSLLDRHTRQRATLQQEAADKGRLTERSPAQHNLAAITGMAKKNGVRVLRVDPVAEVLYPNIQELRYRLETAGTYADHLRFLDEFEQSTFWSDLTFLKIEQTRADMLAFKPVRHGDLVVSFYAGVAREPAKKP